jgi:Flp pilus assembly protein TadD
MATFPADAEAAEMPVMVHAASGQWSDMLLAAQVWRQRTAENPMLADLAIAEAEMQMAEADQAVNQLAPYIQLAQKNPTAHENVIADYCRALVLDARPQDAAAVLQPLLNEPRWRILWLKLASEVHGADAAAQWITQIEPAIAANDFSERQSLAGAWYALGVRYGYAAGFSNARQVITPLTTQANAPASAELLLAASCEKMGDRPAAVTAYRKALQIEPNFPLAENNLAYDLLLQNENLDEARTLAEKAVAAHAEDAAYRDTLGQILIHIGDRPAAIQAYQTLVQMQPNNVSAQITLAQTLLADGKRDSASRVLSQIDALVQADPSNSAAYQRDVLALHQSLK